MAAGFWYWPNTSGVATALSLSRPIVDRPGPYQSMRQSTTTSWSDGISTVQWGGSERITVKHTWDGSAAANRTIRRNLVAFINHMRRGGQCVFAEDVTKLYAAFVQVIPQPGDTGMSIYTPFTDELLSISDTSGYEMVLRSAAPEVLIEAALVSSQTGSGITLSQGMVLDMTSQPWVMIRQWGTFPIMRLPADQRSAELLTHDHEQSFTLELPLEEDEYILGLLASQAGPLSSTSGEVDGISLDDLNKQSNGGPL